MFIIDNSKEWMIAFDAQSLGSYYTFSVLYMCLLSSKIECYIFKKLSLFPLTRPDKNQICQEKKQWIIWKTAW